MVYYTKKISALNCKQKVLTHPVVTFDLISEMIEKQRVIEHYTFSMSPCISEPKENIKICLYHCLCKKKVERYFTTSLFLASIIAYLGDRSYENRTHGTNVHFYKGFTSFYIYSLYNQTAWTVPCSSHQDSIQYLFDLLLKFHQKYSIKLQEEFQSNSYLHLEKIKYLCKTKLSNNTHWNMKSNTVICLFYLANRVMTLSL